MRLEPCDIFFTRSRTLLGRLIRACTRSPGEARTWANHVGVIAEAGEGLNAIGIEALTKVERHSLRDQYGSGTTQMAFYRPIDLSASEKADIIVAAEGYVGDSYGYGKILLHFMDWCLGGVVLFRRLAKVDKYPICSYLVAHAYKAAGLTFGVSEDAASPDDMLDFCQIHPDKYQRINML